MNQITNSMTTEEINAKLVELGPWHLDIELPNGTKTGIANTLKDYDLSNQINLVDPQKMKSLFGRLYGKNGLNGKTFLDVGCNAGGYCFVANELGAKHTYGFDVRNHWINQANFIKEQKKLDDESVYFDTHEIQDLVSKKLKFDVTLFKGVFYHLADPILAMQQLAQITNDLMIIDSGCRVDIPEDCMVPKIEKTKHPMSGMDGLSWYPGGPKLISRIATSMGFPFSKVIYFKKKKYKTDKRDSSSQKTGRFRIIISRTKEAISFKNSK